MADDDIALDFKDLANEPDVAFPGADSDSDDAEAGDNLLGNKTKSSDSKADPKNSLSMWTLEYYQSFFDVSTNAVLKRVAKTFIPFKTSIPPEEQPDLYGPLWVSTTIIIVMAICGNFASYLHFVPEKEHDIWRSDFEKVTLAASTFYTSCFLWPLAIWGYLKHLGSTEIGFTRTASIYGYSLAVYIPTAILSVPRFEWLRWLSVVLAFLISTLNVLNEIWRVTGTIRADKATSPKVFLTMGLFVLIQAGLAVLVKLYFFSYPL